MSLQVAESECQNDGRHELQACKPSGDAFNVELTVSRNEDGLFRMEMEPNALGFSWFFTCQDSSYSLLSHSGLKKAPVALTM